MGPGRSPLRGLLRGLALTALAAVLAACGGNAGGTTPTASTSKKVTVTLSTDLTDPIPGTNMLPCQGVWIPAFEKAHPNITVKVVGGSSGSTDQALYDRVVAAEQAHQAPPVDITDASILPQLAEAHEGLKLSSSEIPRMKEVDPALVSQDQSEAMPYRGSSVVLAYNTQYVHTPPRTLSGLISWIKGHPGKFSYNSPSTGGSGQGFVQAVVDQYVPHSDAATLETGYQPSVESSWQRGLNELHSLDGDIYQNGHYLSCNDQTLQLLGNGAIWMAPVWSDGASAAKASGLLPSSVHFATVTPAFPGGPADLMVLKGTPDRQAAFTLLNWMLSPTAQQLVAKYMQGYPGTEWRYAPASVRKEFKGIESNYAPFWSAKFTADLNAKWQSAVPQS
jgi:putative spermidine/putrescine transport system substrate-binding protein